MTRYQLPIIGRYFVKRSDNITEDWVSHENANNAAYEVYEFIKPKLEELEQRIERLEDNR